MSLGVVFSNPFVLVVCGIWALEGALMGLALLLARHKPAWYQAWQSFVCQHPLGLVVMLVLQLLNIVQTLCLYFLYLVAPSPFWSWVWGLLAAWGVWGVLVLVWRMLRVPLAATGMACSPRLYLGLAVVLTSQERPWLALLAAVLAYACYWRRLPVPRLQAPPRPRRPHLPVPTLPVVGAAQRSAPSQPSSYTASYEEWYTRAENAASWGGLLTGALGLWPLFYPCFVGWLLLCWSRPAPPAVPPTQPLAS